MRRYLILLPAAILAVLLIGLLALWRWTAPPEVASKPSPNSAKQPTFVSDRLLRTARQLWTQADSAEEQPLAAEAVRLADHEIDQAFASALREVATASKTTPAGAKETVARIDDLRARIASEEAQIESLEKTSGKDGTDRVELLKAQLALDQNGLEDDREDLARMGGDPKARIEQSLQEHQSVQHSTAQPRATLALPVTTLYRQGERWLALGGRRKEIVAAQNESLGAAKALRGEHQVIEQRIGTSKPTEDDTDDAAAAIARLRQLSGQKKSLTERDRREQDSLQLAEVYGRWAAAIDGRRLAVGHDALWSIFLIVAIALGVILATLLARRLLGNDRDRRKLHQLRVATNIIIQAAGIALILLVVFGAPTQVSTLIGLATAGLTVALKDFIVAFFGWFALIGKNGIRVGDWVEIEGVGGEVIEIGLLKTVLLEVGNWTSTGHPTGRRVSFMNKFAIENHFFNFSTEGQWLWDELQVTLPTGANPYAMSEQIREVVARETAEDAKQAEGDWERVTSQYGTRPFSAKPAIDLKPTVGGLDVVVRYITRAPQRYDVKSRLFQAIVGMLQTQ